MAELVADRLALFLDAQQARPWDPGTVDCCLFLADWAMWLGHPDPAAHLRGTYSDEAGFESIIREAGGVAPVVAGCVANINGQPLASPHVGAIGVIGSPTNISRQWGAIFDGTHWLVRSRAGVGPLSAKPLAVWEI
jgi:hypothetical protein